MHLASFSIRRPVLVTVATLVAVLLGVVALFRLPMDLLPNMNPPIVAVVTVFPGASAREMSDLVAKPIENAAATVPGVQRIRTIAQESVATVVVQFAWGTNMNQAREELRVRIDHVELPEGAERPILTKFDPTAVPVLQLNIANGQDTETLTRVVKERIIPKLEMVDGVANVSLLGGSEEQIRIELDQAKLLQYRLSPAQVAAVLKASNLNFPSGSLKEGDRQFSIRLTGKFARIDEIENLEISRIPVPISPAGEGIAPSAAGATARSPGATPATVPTTIPVRLKDVATVRVGFAERSSLVRQDGQTAVGLAIQKESGANTVAVADGVQDAIEQLKKEVPDLRVTVVSDTAEIIRSSIYDLARDLILGSLLAVSILWLFLRSVRTTLLVGISIPVSVVFTFLLLYLNGRGLNLMTLGGLTLAVGLIIDDSIVVAEAIHRHLAKGKAPTQAAIDGTAEVATAVVASTLTTVAVFVPVVFVPGVAGEIFKELALSVSFSLLASLLVSFTLVPMVAARILRHPRTAPDHGPEAHGVVPDSSLSQGYRRLLAWVLENRVATLLAAVAVLAASLWLVPKIGSEFIPTTDEGQFQITVKMPPGTNLEATATKVHQIESVLHANRSIASYSVTVGTGQGLDAMLGGVGDTGPNTAVFTVTVKKGSKKTDEIMAEIRRETDKIANPAKVTFNLQSTVVRSVGGLEPGVTVTVSAPDQATLEKYVPQVEQAVVTVQGVTGTRNNLSVTRPEVQIRVDRAKAMQYGLTPGQVALHMALAVKGEVVSRFEADGRSYEMFLVLQPEDRASVEKLKEILIPSPLGQPVRLGDVATVVNGSGPVSIVREDRRVAAQITAFFEGRDLGSVAADIQSKIRELGLPDTVKVSQAGLADLMLEGFEGLTVTLVLAVVLVFLIMAAEFESFRHPLVILLSLPLSVTGVLLGLWLSGYHFGITAFIGVIMLVGIVVKNGIILIDYINLLKSQGTPTLQAVLDGAAVRVRPVLMTAIAAALGLVPLALGMGGSGAKLMTPLAVAVVGGLTSSTLLTLAVVPVVYTFFELGFVPLRTRRTRPSALGGQHATVELLVDVLEKGAGKLTVEERHLLVTLLRRLQGEDSAAQE